MILELLVHLYGDGTVQVSILYECSLLVEWCTIDEAIYGVIYM
jgi:hypothetical protein